MKQTANPTPLPTLPDGVQLRPEREDDLQAIEALHDIAFGPGRYARTAFRLREMASPADAFAFVAVNGAGLLGSVRFSHIMIGGKPALLLGPLAVHPSMKHRGVGKALVAHTLNVARDTDVHGVLLVGDLPYYGPLGFACVGGRVQMPGPVDPSRLLLAHLADEYAAWAGAVQPV